MHSNDLPAINEFGFHVLDLQQSLAILRERYEAVAIDMSQKLSALLDKTQAQELHIQTLETQVDELRQLLQVYHEMHNCNDGMCGYDRD